MDGQGGGRQEITWERYNGARRSRFATDDRVYESGYGAPMPPALPRNERIEETKITERHIHEETARRKTRDKMWTEITKDLVIKEAIDEMGYSFEETDEFFYVVEYLRYVCFASLLLAPPKNRTLTAISSTGGRPTSRPTHRRYPAASAANVSANCSGSAMSANDWLGRKC